VMDRVAGGAVHHAAALLGSLRVDPGRMAENIASDGGLVMAERVALELSASTGRAPARDLVRRCSEQSAERHIAFADVVRDDPEVRRHLSEKQIAAALEPSRSLGSIEELIQRALYAHGPRA
jgi:adenylosuccinate lyase